ncbi:hypothetical protein BCR36DRAFT_585661 [Piromyces finnis]|uniref:F-box domain-containing protein n=1 Tax=Piromyces finnis TaxID=1754191 RepID=A0A1Y1V2S6_9FUNG|nr:hypothetical protein BCR36DRAFT_585661 [Piromyces finnis]|eukprot:ORX45346.1 hypothetical protein BCR36DRAFT_585661 [Piromyces finnis]
MSKISVLIGRLKKFIFYLIIFCLVRSYLRRKRGDDGNKRISGPPERKRITDERKQELEEKPSNSLKNDKENIEESESSNEKATVSLENTETAVDDDFKKEENIKESVEDDLSLSLTEEIKDPKLFKESNLLDIEKTEVINDNENEMEVKTREIVINNIEVIPDEIIVPNHLILDKNDIQIQNEIVEDIKNSNNKPTDEILSLEKSSYIEEEVMTNIETEENKSKAEELINEIEEEIVEESEQLIETIEENAVPQEPEKVNIESTEALEETSNNVEIEEKIIESTVEDVADSKEIIENIVENEPAEKEEEKINDEISSIPLDESTKQSQLNNEVMEEIIQLPIVEEQQPASTISNQLEKEEEKPEITEESSRDMQKVSENEPQSIELLISEIEKVVNDSESDVSFIKENELEQKSETDTEKIVESKPVVNAADIIGHEEIIYENDVDGDDDGEWVDDDDGEWIDEDEDDGEWVDEDDEDKEIEEVKPEINKRQSLLINTNMDITQKRQSLIFNNTPIDSMKRQSLLLNNSIDILKSSLMAPLASNNNTLPVVAPPEEEKSKVLPDAILDRIFRETDPQTMWVLRNTSLKTRAIVDNILKETFEQFDLSMDPLYFDVTSKENLGLVLNSLDLSPFALAMLLHEILKLDSQHIGYAFGQMYRVPSKIDIDYLTDLIVETLSILKRKRDVDISDIMLGLQQYYCFNHSELEFYELFDLIEMTPQEVAKFIQNHHHFILSKSLPPLLKALDVDEVFVSEMCKSYANDDMDAFARIISKVPVQYVRTSIFPGDVQGDRVVVVNENGENVIVVLNDEKNKQNHSNKSTHEGEWEEEEEAIEDNINGESMIIVENNESFSLMVGRILRFLNMSTSEVASLFKYLPEYCSYDEEEILEGLNWNEEQIAEMRQIMKDEQDKIARKMKELSKLIIQRRISISNMNSPLGSPVGRSPSVSSSGSRLI